MMRRISLLLVAALAAGALAQDEFFEDRTLSPYFQVISADSGTEQLPLLSTSAGVSIAGVIADVKVTQVYKNSGQKPIEAIYVFPASTRAAVYAMKMTIGTRIIEAEIREREQARQEYEVAKQQGKTASLLEQQRPNVFQMNVANIMPGDTIKVEMSYTELLVPTEGVYEFIYPTVVGPRYSNKGATGAAPTDAYIETPYTHQGELPAYTFDIRVDVSAGMPIQELVCPSHKTGTAFDGLSRATVQLDTSERFHGNKDFILKYRLTGGKVQTGMLLYKGEEENFFLAMVQPPQRVKPEEMPAREYIFIMDVSGSMHGYPINISKKLMRDLLLSLRPKDVFNVLLFAAGSAVMADAAVPATEANIEKALAVIDEQSGGGGTEIVPALQRALALPRTKGTSRTVIIATDGYVAVEPEVFDLIRSNLGAANMFAFGIGTSVNRQLIEGIAHVGRGEPFIITSEDKAAAEADRFRKYVSTPVLTGVSAEFRGFETYDVEPLRLPDVLAERPVIIFGKWRGEPAGSLVVRGTSGKGAFTQELKTKDFPPGAGNSALRYLWARDRIRMLSDYANLQEWTEDSAIIKEVTGLGLKYTLMTQYTSFIAVDKVIRNVNGKPEVVKQPLPLPEGVSDYAVGMDGGADRVITSAAFSKLPVSRLTEIVGVQAGVPGGRRTKDGGAVPPVPADGEWGRLIPPPNDLNRGNPAARVTVLKFELSDSMLWPHAIEKVWSLMAAVESLYDREHAAAESLGGQLAVKFDILMDGSVANALAEKNDLNAAIEEFVLRRLRRLNFGNPTGKDIAVRIEFAFTP